LDNDGQFDDATGVTATFNSGTEGAFTVAVKVTDDDGATTTDLAVVTVTLPSVTIAATDNDASEAGLDTGVFTVTRSGATTFDLEAMYSVAGTATAGTDFNSLPGSVTIPAGSSQATIVVMPIDDGDSEGTETVIVTILDTAAYHLGSPSSDTVTLADNDQVLLLSDSFEVSQWNGLWVEDTQNDWSRSSKRASDGTHAAEVKGPASNTRISDPTRALRSASLG
jgi:hypothetical protein